MKSLGPPELGPGVEPALEAESALEPVRLLDSASSAFERRLLASAAQDAMPAAALQQLAQALHVPSSALPTLGAELQRTAWLGKYVTLAGLGALGVIAGVVANGGRAAPARTATAPVAAVVTPAPTPAPETVSLSEVSSAEMSPAAVSPAAVSPAAVSPAAVSPAAVSPAEVSPADAPRIDVSQWEPARPKISHPRPRASARATAQPQPQPSTAQPQPSTAQPQPSTAQPSTAQGLRAELQALETVQRELRAQHAQLAADALAAYFRRFPAGELVREAELLGVDIALARGDRELARARARELLAKPDGARYRERLEALRIESGGASHGSPEVIR